MITSKKVFPLISKIIFYSLFFCFLLNPEAVQGQETTLIFPVPQEIKTNGEVFKLDEQVIILVPQYASENDLRLARALVRDLSNQYGIALTVKHGSELPDENRKYILMGTIDNPLIKAYCRSNEIEVSAGNPGKEGYVLVVKENRVVVAGWDDAGAFYGLQSLRQLVQDKEGYQLTGVQVRDWPVMPFRGIRLYIPGPENIAFFKRFLRDFMALYKFNKVIIEANCMRLNRHPEVNAGWIEFSKYMKYTRTSELLGIHGQTRNSGHQDAGDGFILEQDDVKKIVEFAGENFIEVIPEIPSLTHGFYLLTRHPELAEYEADIWPDTYCPSNPATYDLMFDVLDEYIDVMNPKMIHIGHDEWRGAPLDSCRRCRGRDYSELFAEDVNKLHSYLQKKNIKVAMWGDFLLESVRGKGPHDQTSATGLKYQTPGGLRPEVVRESIPKDILMFNWFWGDHDRDMELHNFGFAQIYGNFKPNISNWDSRIHDFDLIGGAPSAWISTNEFTFGKDLVLDFLGCANLLWSKHTIRQIDLAGYVWEQLPVVRRNFRGYNAPSDDGDPVEPVDISAYFNLRSNTEVFGINLNTLKSGDVTSGSKYFKLGQPGDKNSKKIIGVGVRGKGPNPLTTGLKGIPINEDVSSLIFLHASAKPAGNQKSYFDIYNTFDTADLLGWYEVVYEDGFVEIIPIQYGVNILEWNPGGDKSLDPAEGDTGSPQNAYCYNADVVDCSTDMGNNPIRFYAYEWTNKRFGKKIKEVNLIGSDQYQAVQPVYSEVVTEPLPSNGILLLGISKVTKREVEPWK
ncbi:MAG: beta-N-acetylhexosaminidase [Cyclobacteriaceae bacterium]|nr:beta-N-acetylhexosaminidase [Cyclobacteriaceae bacterium]